MKDIIKKYIEVEAKKHSDRYHIYHNSLHIEHERNKKRFGEAYSNKEVKKPFVWSVDKKYNPFYVLKNSEKIASAIAKKIKEGTYKPKAPYIHEIPKGNGKKREITVYQIPDAAVSNYLYKRLLSKNKHRLSSLSYAYRNDRNVHFAIQDIGLDLQSNSRLFVSEFDFSDFFGSINHQYLYDQLDQNGFMVSDFEKQIIESFLGSLERGIPQGTSISLFLANIVCWKLDRSLESEGLRFARYADDTVVWSSNYNKICESFELISKFSKEAGIEINADKSNGINLMVKPGLPSEFDKTKEYIEFLGYKLSLSSISIKEESVNKIKKQISYLLYKNLIKPLKGYQLKNIIVPSNDEDPALVTAMMQIRRYLYGNLSESKLKSFVNGKYKRIRFKGIMSFYPLIDDVEQLKELDGWLKSTIYNTLKLRKKLFLKKNILRVSYNFPFNVSEKDLITRFKSASFKGTKGIYEIPSFLRIYQGIKNGITNNGIEYTMNEKAFEYDY
ncbi:reverse transcriptase domain-containing protein [Halobacillus aidingensis]|uniref:Reverse transcriptase (RNA-dependent DNA polymerase) n=1 Tax=Halobacillus aidingensis TaxID=240303 RepID=A0A1H0IFD7_HALAD|nr:reverse transcriptase domain-containing protein [Halobacillus aidingensis]SDO30199.1 Reverse transcriptase (RNA-dependent DNA polymerase) [Halobacillus aidingensis]